MTLEEYGITMSLDHSFQDQAKNLSAPPCILDFSDTDNLNVNYIL